MTRNIKRIRLITLFQIVGLVIGLFCVLAPKSSAQASQQHLVVGDITTCTNNSSSYYDTLSQPITGSIYARLPSGTSPSVVYLYSETTSDTSCQLLGAAKIVSGRWLFLGSGSAVTNIMIQSPGLNAQPYAAVVDLLVVPNTAICAPVVYCNLNYQGDAGYLVPSLVSNTTDQIAVYEAKSTTDVRFTGINYYSDGTFLYSSTQLRPINTDYLPGGKHNIFIQINFVNGEKVNINQTINMGIDWSGTLRLRSDFYRSHNKFIFAGVVMVILAIILLLLWFVRKIYKRREFKIDHGIDEYEDLDMIDRGDKPDDSHPIVG
jgi:hypothetical protein